MKKCLVTVACLLGFVSAAQAAPITFNVLLSGPAEAPPNASPGTGSGTITIDPVAHTLGIDLTFSGLLGTTTAAHIHCCNTAAASGTGTAGVATTTPSFVGFPLGVTSGTFSTLLDTTNPSTWNPAFITSTGSIANAETALFNGIIGGYAYFNIHTSQVGGGEIRGFPVAAAVPVPEPGTLVLLGLGLAGLWRARRRMSA